MINLRFVIWQYLNPAYLQAHPISEDDLRRLEEIKLKPEDAAPDAALPSGGSPGGSVK